MKITVKVTFPTKLIRHESDNHPSERHTEVQRKDDMFFEYHADFKPAVGDRIDFNGLVLAEITSVVYHANTRKDVMGRPAMVDVVTVSARGIW